MRNKRLSRQVKKFFGDESMEVRLKDLLANLNESVGGIPDLQAVAALTHFAQQLPAFLDAVNEAYDQSDEKVTMAQRSVEISNAELTEVNQNLFALNKTFDAMVNSLGQGFFIFGRDGICLPVYTKACLTLLEREPAGLHIGDLLGVPDEKQDYLRRWCDLLFKEVIAFSDIATAGPNTYKHSKRLEISIEYKPVRDHEGKIELIVGIVTDRTSEVRAKQQASEMQAFAVFVSSIVRNRERFRRFVESTRGLLRDTWKLLDCALIKKHEIETVKRNLHTIKGISSSFGMHNVKEMAHELESMMDRQPDRAKMHNDLRRGTKALAELFESTLRKHSDVIGDTLSAKDPIREIPLPVLNAFEVVLEGIGHQAEVARQKFKSDLLSVPLAKVFGHFDFVLTDAAEKLNKKINPMVVTGGEIRILPEKLEDLTSSLVHVFRNIADHGIEKEDVRRNLKKAPEGSVAINFEPLQIGDKTHLRIVISDDGGGIDVTRLKERMKSRGEKYEHLTDEHIMQTIFDAGVTTATKISEYSGRGIGLNAVKAEVEKLGGKVQVSSVLGKGTTFTLTFPYDLAAEFTGFDSAVPKYAA